MRLNTAAFYNLYLFLSTFLGVVFFQKYHPFDVESWKLIVCRIPCNSAHRIEGTTHPCHAGSSWLGRVRIDKSKTWCDLICDMIWLRSVASRKKMAPTYWTKLIPRIYDTRTNIKKNKIKPWFYDICFANFGLKIPLLVTGCIYTHLRGNLVWFRVMISLVMCLA